MTFNDVLGPLISDGEVVNYLDLANRLAESYSRNSKTAVTLIGKEIKQLQSRVNRLKVSKESNPDYFTASYDLAKAEEKLRIVTNWRYFTEGTKGLRKLDALTFKPIASSIP